MYLYPSNLICLFSVVFDPWLIVLDRFSAVLDYFWPFSIDFQLLFNRFEVPFEILKQGFNAFSNAFLRRIFVLSYLQIGFSGHFAVSPRLLSPRACRMQFIDNCFCDFPGFTQQSQIRGIGDVLRTGRGIIDHFALVADPYFNPIA